MSKKGRFYIQIKEIFDNGFALGSMQDYVDIMNDLDKQNENKDKQIAELKQQLAEKDRIIKEREEALDRKTKKNLQDYFAEKKRFYYLACADIRKKLVKYNHINWTIIQDILNQIEKVE